MTFSYTNAHGAGDFMVKVASYLTSHEGLISKPNAKKIAKENGMKVEEVEFSWPWYIANAADFMRRGVKLPPITAVKLHSIGETSQFCLGGLHRASRDDGDDAKPKPVLMEEDVMAFIHSDPKYTVYTGDARVLAQLINQTHFGPPKERLRVLIDEFQMFCRAIIAKNEGKVAPANNLPMAGPAMDLGGGEGLTKTQMADLFVMHMTKTGEIVEAIQNIVSFLLLCAAPM